MIKLDKRKCELFEEKNGCQRKALHWNVSVKVQFSERITAACRKYFNSVIFGTYHIGLVSRLFVVQKNLFYQQLKKGVQTCIYFHT